VDPAAMPPATFREVLRAAAARFEEAGDARNLAAALTDLALIDWLGGRAVDMAEAAERALAAADRSRDPRAIQEAAPLLAAALIRGPTPLPDVLSRIASTRERLGEDRLTAAILQLTEASALALMDRVQEAGVIAGHARATFRDLGQRRWLAAADQTQAEIARQAGDLAKAVALRREIYAFFQEQGDALNAMPAGLGLADLLLVEGRIAEADRLAQLAEEQDTGDDLEVRVVWMCIRAVTAAAAGDRARADHLAETAIRMVDATDFVLIQADARAVLAQAATPEGADRLRREAAERFGAKGAVSPPALRSA